MAPWLIALTGVIYVWVAADLAWSGRHGLAIAYAGYGARMWDFSWQRGRDESRTKPVCR